jgi:hypothetical protein
LIRLAEAVRVTVEAFRVLLEAMRVIIEAVRKIIEAVRLLEEAGRVSYRRSNNIANPSSPFHRLIIYVMNVVEI